MIREIARVLSDERGKEVVIIDTSNEIGGDEDLPHPRHRQRGIRLRCPTRRCSTRS